MFKVNNKNTRKTSLTSVWSFYCYISAYFSVSVVVFEQVIVFWVSFQDLQKNYDEALRKFTKYQRSKKYTNFFSSTPSPKKKIFSSTVQTVPAPRFCTFRKDYQVHHNGVTEWNLLDS